MATPATRRRTGPKPGVRQYRQPKARKAARIEQALNALGTDGLYHPVAEDEWAKLREATWAEWAKLAAVINWPKGPQDDHAAPPYSAVHDGIVGRALRWGFTKDSGPWDARPVIKMLAEEGLAEVEDFKKQRPAAARSISKPLKTYTKILHDLRDHPEYGLTP